MKDKNTAGILAFFLGGIGVHRFYLGQTGLGILYLLFCWTLIPALIAIIDAIIFWAGDPESFNKKYNKGKETVHQTNTWPESNAFEIVGIKHRMEAFEKCNDHDELILKAEPENEHDNTAVAVYHKDTVTLIGYIPRDQKVKLFAYLTLKKRYSAQMIGKNVANVSAGCAVFADDKLN